MVKGREVLNSLVLIWFIKIYLYHLSFYLFDILCASMHLMMDANPL